MAKASRRSRTVSPYTLRQGNKIVYVGITKDPETREQQHRDEGKRFGKLRVEGPKRTSDSAAKWEEQKLAGYRATHGGRNPKHNETKEG